MSENSIPDSSFESVVRRALLSLVLLGILGFGIELLLTGHYDETWQTLPLVVLAVALIATSWVWLRPSLASARFFQGNMSALIITGLLGVWRHYAGNAEFEIERNADLKGLALIWESLRGATPILAPGALAQLGLLGLVYTFRHPALRRGR